MRSFHRILAGAVITGGALLCGCATPLGPGYTLKKQQYIVSWTGAGELSLRSEYRLENTGNQPLDYIEVTLPAEPRRSGLQVWLDQSPVTVTAAAAVAPAGTVRIPISPALPQKQKRNLVIEYRLAGATGDYAFYLETKGWYPELRQREGLFGSGGAPPEKWDLRITVPRDFLVHASGQRKGEKRRGDLVEHRFRQRADCDSAPFVIAGRFYEQRLNSSGAALTLWTPQPTTPASAQSSLQRLAKTVSVVEQAFGPLSKDGDAKPLLVAESGLSASPDQDELVTFPNAIWTDSPILTAPDSPCGLILEITSLWFFHLSHPEPEANDTAWALSQYASWLAPRGCDGVPEQRDPEAFAAYVRVLLQAFDEAKAAQAEHPDAGTKWTDSARAKLFVVALEDYLGRERLIASLKRMLQSLRGSTWTKNDLRAAIHLETGEDPAEFFRQWLNQPGIPDEFRKKYEGQASGNR